MSSQMAVARGYDESPLAKLSDKQRMFVEYYLQCWNATEAARRANYAEANKQGPRLLVNVGIRQAIEQRISEVAMSSDEVLLRLARMARGSIEPFLSDPEDGAVFIDLTSDKATQNLDLLRKAKTKRRVSPNPLDPWTETETEIELHDPKDALVHLGRHHRLFSDKVDISGLIRHEHEHRHTVTLAEARKLPQDERRRRVVEALGTL